LKQFQNFAKKEDLPFLLVSGEIDEIQKGQKSDLIALSVAYYYSQKKQKKHGRLRELVNNADLIVIDEAHHTPANMIKSLLLDSPNSIRLRAFRYTAQGRWKRIRNFRTLKENIVFSRLH